MSRPWIFISPSSRGVGAALTAHLLRTTRLPILATTRSSPSEARDRFLASAPKDAADRLHVVVLDVTKEDTMAAAAERAAALFPRKTHHLHLALAIPGILHPEKNPAQVDYAKALATYQVNTLGPLMLMKHFHAFLPRNTTKLAAPGEEEEEEGANNDGDAQSRVTLPRHATWLSMSARVGSITDNRAGGWYSYRSSKTGVSSLVKSFDNYLKTRSGDNAVAVAFHPGTVKTDLSRDFWDGVPEGRLLEPDYAAERLVDVVSTGIGLEGRGKLWDWQGEEIKP
ncbi:oxidoreductase [Verticillium alfalfae VaMs.102]|uniref:Oxidoreductase n=1 Tax=Verticillium alfalfae (strain VaMs.102 / ATCC MYA-4576 / FGSC 10136) TaxID=526221 RepID=C9SBA0_VERA1|nr:oxidoreductase [Verticillium alfalfae VaMs.102]EEY15650.1 oxidoreductase [Verticillium alfalfae VaMs.102]